MDSPWVIHSEVGSNKNRGAFSEDKVSSESAFGHLFQSFSRQEPCSVEDVSFRRGIVDNSRAWDQVPT